MFYSLRRRAGWGQPRAVNRASGVTEKDKLHQASSRRWVRLHRSPGNGQVPGREGVLFCRRRNADSKAVLSSDIRSSQETHSR